MAEERVTRKLAAILYADVAGYSRLTGEDEEGTHKIVAEYLDAMSGAISEHGGRVVHYAGDAVLADFSSVVSAVKCAVEIQDNFAKRNADIPDDRKVQFRIGVNLGDVIVDRDDIYGNGVNVAARLESIADPGGICISGKVLEEVQGKIDVGFDDLGPQTVKNIAQPIPAFRITSGPGSVIITSSVKAAARKRTIAIAAVCSLLIAGGIVWWSKPWNWQTETTYSEPTEILHSSKPSIAVIPFENLSGEVSQDYFSDGLTEDIINALGRYQDLAVMAYNAALPFRGQAADSQNIRKELGVRYLVQGTVRRAKNKVRITSRLTDAQNGTVLWSEQFDKEYKDILEIQDAITRRIAGTLISNLTRVERQRALSKPPTDLGAYDLVLQGRAELRRATRRSNRRGRLLFDRALKRDANYATAYAWLGRAHYLVATDGWTEFPARALERAESFAQQALTLDPRSVEALRILARIHAIKIQLGRALAEIDQAIAINPSDAEALGDRGLILLWGGKPEEALAAFELAFAFDPNLRSDYVFTRGLSYYSLRRHEDAIRVLERGASRYPDYVFIRVALVAAYGQLGKKVEAKRNAEAVKRLLPIFNPKIFGSRFQDPALREYLWDGLKKGGLL